MVVSGVDVVVTLVVIAFVDVENAVFIMLFFYAGRIYVKRDIFLRLKKMAQNLLNLLKHSEEVWRIV